MRDVKSQTQFYHYGETDSTGGGRTGQGGGKPVHLVVITTEDLTPLTSPPPEGQTLDALGSAWTMSSPPGEQLTNSTDQVTSWDSMPDRGRTD